MSEDKRGATDDDSDLAEAPFLDDLERAESAWLLARENDPGAPPPSPEIARHYDELEDLLGAMPPPLAGDSSKEATRPAPPAPSAAPPTPSTATPATPTATPATPAATPATPATPAATPATPAATPVRPRPRRRVSPWAFGGALAAAAAVVLILVLRPGPRPDAEAGELVVAIRHRDVSRADAKEAAVGDRLVIRTRARAREVAEVRVYRADGPLVARCPGGPGCSTPAPGEHALDVRLEAPVPHHVVLVFGTGALPVAPPDATMDAFLDAARAANARVITHPPIEVH